MRDPRRIDKVLKLIKKIWKQRPELRLMQLIGNVFGPNSPDNYYKEDGELMFLLRSVYIKEVNNVEEKKQLRKKHKIRKKSRL